MIVAAEVQQALFITVWSNVMYRFLFREGILGAVFCIKN